MSVAFLRRSASVPAKGVSTCAHAKMAKDAGIANIAVGSELYEEALVIFKKAELHREAAKVLIDYIASIERATEFADKVDDPEVWTMLGKAQMTPEGIVAAIDAFIKAGETSEYMTVISVAEQANEPAKLVEYLQMCRKKVKEAHIDTSLIYAYAKAEMHPELEEFISAPNVGRIQDVAERCYAEEMYVPAKLMFTSISNFARLATCLVRLGEFQASVDAARKANSTRTWKEVNASCVEAGEFRLAQICALHIIVNPDEVDELVGVYEVKGHFEEIIAVMEAGRPRACCKAVSLFTRLAVDRRGSASSARTWASSRSSACSTRSTRRRSSWSTSSSSGRASTSARCSRRARRMRSGRSSSSSTSTTTSSTTRPSP